MGTVTTNQRLAPPRPVFADRALPSIGEDGLASNVVVVTPTYNEVDALPVHAERVLGLGSAYRLVIVDDASPDGTGAVADRLAADHPGRIDVVHRLAKDGLGGAYVAGLRAALRGGAEFVAMMDADGSHDPADLARMVATGSRADVVLGSRYAPGGSTVGWPLRRRMLSRIGGRYAGILLGLPIADPTSGFRIMRRAAVEAIDLGRVRAAGYAVNLELTWRAVRAGLVVVEVPIAFRERATGASKLSAAIVAEAALLVWRLRFADESPRSDRDVRTAGRDPVR